MTTQKDNVLYFVGCTTAYRNSEIAEATVAILKKAKVRFSVFGLEEECCGLPLLNAGFRKTVEYLARRNVKAIEKRKPTLVLTTCPTCCMALRLDYPEILGDVKFKTVHITEFLADLVGKGRLKFAKNGGKVTKVTFHDPCHLGLHMGVFDPPREVLKSIPNVEFVEMERNRNRSYCCGSGGGPLRAAFPELAMSMAEERVKEAKATGAEILITSCPDCLFNLEQAVRRAKLDLKAIDLGVFIANRLA